MPIARRMPPMSNKRVRYASDPAFRRSAQAIARNGYRKRVGMETQSCLYSLEFIDKLSKEFTVTSPDGEVVTVKGFSVPMAAEVLQQLYQTVWRWIGNQIIPAPMFTRIGPNGNKPYLVYHLEEVRILVEEVGEHEKTMAYLRKDHVETRGRIERRILEFRNKLKF